jgi:hypothetical protein
MLTFVPFFFFCSLFFLLGTQSGSPTCVSPSSALTDTLPALSVSAAPASTFRPALLRRQTSISDDVLSTSIATLTTSASFHTEADGGRCADSCSAFDKAQKVRYFLRLFFPCALTSSLYAQDSCANTPSKNDLSNCVCKLSRSDLLSCAKCAFSPSSHPQLSSLTFQRHSLDPCLPLR